jgi:hypothetical protein
MGYFFLLIWYTFSNYYPLSMSDKEINEKVQADSDEGFIAHYSDYLDCAVFGS